MVLLMDNMMSRRKELQTSPGPAALVTITKRVSVVYYISRNGHLEHPHFMEVPLSCPDGLYLKDVISRLNLLRGNGMSSMYSWSSKRTYKNGFVWHDLSEDDYIHPVHGLEYVIKGTEILDSKKQRWSSGRLHLHETESAREADNEKEVVENEGSPPPVDSSPETLESLMKADKRLVTVETETKSTEEEEMQQQSERLKASSVLLQLITCGSFSFRHSGTTPNGVKLISKQHKAEESSSSCSAQLQQCCSVLE